MKKYKTIIYDIDGTLLDTLKMNLIPLQRIIKEELGIDMEYKELLRYVSYPGLRVLEELKITNKEEVYARWVDYVNSYEEGATPYDGVESVLNTFHQHNIIQAIVSSKTKKQYEIDFVSKGFNKYIKVAILADDTVKHKPDPEPLIKCLEQLQLSKEDVIYIGDSDADYLAAKNAGIDFGYAKWGSVNSDGIDSPKFTFEKPTDLLKLLKR